MPTSTPLRGRILKSAVYSSSFNPRLLEDPSKQLFAYCLGEVIKNHKNITLSVEGQLDAVAWNDAKGLTWISDQKSEFGRRGRGHGSDTEDDDYDMYGGVDVPYIDDGDNEVQELSDRGAGFRIFKNDDLLIMRVEGADGSERMASEAEASAAASTIERLLEGSSVRIVESQLRRSDDEDEDVDMVDEDMMDEDALTDADIASAYGDMDTTGAQDEKRPDLMLMHARFSKLPQPSALPQYTPETREALLRERNLRGGLRLWHYCPILVGEIKSAKLLSTLKYMVPEDAQTLYRNLGIGGMLTAAIQLATYIHSVFTIHPYMEKVFIFAGVGVWWRWGIVTKDDYKTHLGGQAEDKWGLPFPILATEGSLTALRYAGNKIYDNYLGATFEAFTDESDAEFDRMETYLDALGGDWAPKSVHDVAVRVFVPDHYV